MRKMRRGNTVVEIHEHIWLANRWEIYVIEKPNSDGIGFGIINGFECEMGSFDMEEYQGLILSRTENLDYLMPAPCWYWED